MRSISPFSRTSLERRAGGPIDPERGGSPASFMIVFIIVLLIAELVVIGGRLAGAQAAVENAARAAARQGTLVQEQSQVRPVLRATALANLNNAGQSCAPITAEPLFIGSFGADGFVEAQVVCTVKLSDLSPLGLPLPDVSVTGNHREIIEKYRAIGVVAN